MYCITAVVLQQGTLSFSSSTCRAAKCKMRLACSLLWSTVPFNFVHVHEYFRPTLSITLSFHSMICDLITAQNELKYIVYSKISSKSLLDGRHDTSLEETVVRLIWGWLTSYFLPITSSLSHNRATATRQIFSVNGKTKKYFFLINFLYSIYHNCTRSMQTSSTYF